MTREEALEILDTIPTIGEQVDALEMAINALEQEPIIHCKDCKYKVVTDDGEYNPEDIVCSYWASDGLEEDDFCSFAEPNGE